MTLRRMLGMTCLVFASTAVSLGSARGEEDPPLIPRDVLFGNPDRLAPEISGDGEQLAFLAPHHGVMNVWVARIDALDQARPVTNSTERPIRSKRWAHTNAHILYIQDRAGDENWRVYAVDLETGTERDITPGEAATPSGSTDEKDAAASKKDEATQSRATEPHDAESQDAESAEAGSPPTPVQARIEAVSHRFPDEIIVGVNARTPELHDLYRVNLRTGEATLVEQNDQRFMGYTIDDEYRVRLASSFTPDGGIEIFARQGEDWASFGKVPQEDTLTTQPLLFDKSGQVLYLVDSRGRNTAALTAVNMKTGTSEVLFANDQADVHHLATHPTEKTVQAASVNYLRDEWHVLDDAVRRDFEYLKTVSEGELSIASRTMDDRTWIVTYTLDHGPAKYYRYDRDANKATFLFTNRSALEGLSLAKMHPLVITSRDGHALVSYLSLPVQADPDQDGRPSSPMPTVLLVHGGPWGRDTWGYDAWHQWLANRGYAVLSVNFRGSTGFGKAFINAGDLEWAGKMHDDLLDAVEWAAAEKIADPKKVAIMGGSYGGYATLVGLTFTPNRFAAGVDIVGPSNLLTLLESIPPYWAPMIELFKKRMGDPSTQEGKKLLEERSPLFKADQITRPLLIGQGANDPRVKQAESDQIVEAMTAREIPVTYVLFPDEGHGFARPQNTKAFNAVAEAFLAEHLGGRYEPVGGDFEGASLQVETGVEGVPGLAEALKK